MGNWKWRMKTGNDELRRVLFAPMLLHTGCLKGFARERGLGVDPALPNERLINEINKPTRCTCIVRGEGIPRHSGHISSHLDYFSFSVDYLIVHACGSIQQLFTNLKTTRSRKRIGSGIDPACSIPARATLMLENIFVCKPLVANCRFVLMFRKRSVVMMKRQKKEEDTTSV